MRTRTCARVRRVGGRSQRAAAPDAAAGHRQAAAQIRQLVRAAEAGFIGLSFEDRSAALCKPEHIVHVCDGSEAETSALLHLKQQRGTVKPLPKYDNW